MIVKFNKASFLMPVNFNSVYQQAIHCLGIVLKINDYERCILAPIKVLSEDKEETIALCWLSVPEFANSMDIFQHVTSLGGNIVTTPLTITDELARSDLSGYLPLQDGEFEANLSLSNFFAVVRTESCLARLTITPAGFLRLALETSAPAIAR